MTKTIFVILQSAFLFLPCGCTFQTRSELDVRIEMLRNDIHRQRLRLSEIESLKTEIAQIRQKTKEVRARNKKFVNETPGLRDKVKRHYREAEALKP